MKSYTATIKVTDFKSNLPVEFYQMDFWAKDKQHALEQADDTVGALVNEECIHVTEKLA